MTELIHALNTSKNSDICASMVKQSDYDRYLTTLFVTEEQRRSLNALYAFNIEISKIAEACSETLAGEIRLQWWRDSLKSVSLGEPQAHPVLEELALLFPQHQITAHDLMLIINARSSEMHGEPIEDVTTLVERCRLTAGTLNRLTLAIMSKDLGHSHIAQAEKIGTAWGLIGVIRNIPFHASTQQCYLPQNLLRELKIETEDLYRGVYSPKLKDIIRQLISQAETLLKDGLQTLPKKHRNAFLSGPLTRSYLKQLRKASYDIEEVDFYRGKTGRLIGLTWSALTGKL